MSSLSDDRRIVLRASDFPHGFPLGPTVCGIDEAGRGPLAGPVTAACVILPDDFPLDILDDSKALSAKKREMAFDAIRSGSIAWALGWASHLEIDRLNILGATMLAMGRAFRCLGRQPGSVYVDGNRIPELGGCADGIAVRAVIGGDALIPAIMAASILAKVSRDRVMEGFDFLYPEYCYARHKGYPTASHRAICRARGPSPIQRASFSY